jgi:pseudaminic acid cytidylyltransferase
MYLAIIPARSGSKRLKNKNIKLFFGYPIIRYPIHEALQSKLFKEIIVSTDCDKIKNIALKCGASVPFLRQKKLSNDFTPLHEVLTDVLTKIKKNFQPKYFCLIYATSPLIDKNDIIKSINYLKKTKNKVDSICSVCKYEHPIQRALNINKKNLLEFFNKNYTFKRSQDLNDCYYDAATFAWFNTKNFLKKKGINLKILPYVLPGKKVQDINTLKDFKIAKIKYKYLTNLKN